jgi:UDP-2-acetamido-3-amino-2,3-dideoxy-glucuronate N-acetyltransferase
MIHVNLLRRMNNCMIHPTAIVDQGALIGEGTKIWHFSHVMDGSVIGKNCTIGQNVFIASGVVLGNNVKVQNNVSVYTGVICEDDVFLGPSMVFTNVMNPRSAVIRKDSFQKTIVEKGVSIGANATIVCGVTLGRYCFIGAGSVVVHNVPAYALVVGNPARQTGWMSEAGEKLLFFDGRYAQCPLTGEKYGIENGIVRKISGPSPFIA